MKRIKGKGIEAFVYEPAIKEEDFFTTWNTVKGMVGLLETDYTLEDLSYERVTINRHVMQEASY